VHFEENFRTYSISSSLFSFYIKMTIGVPIKLLHEAQGHIISLELKTGQLYRGKLLEGKTLNLLDSKTCFLILYLYRCQ
jgi:hypothetical protein